MQPWTTLAEWTGLEPATPGVTGRYSNQLNYHSKLPNLCRTMFYSTWRHFRINGARLFGVPKGIRTPVLTVKG